VNGETVAIHGTDVRTKEAREEIRTRKPREPGAKKREKKKSQHQTQE